MKITAKILLLVVLTGAIIFYVSKYVYYTYLVNYNIREVAKNSKFENVYFEMIEAGDLNAVKKVININSGMANIERKNELVFALRTPICAAAYRGKKDIVKFLISKGIDVNSKTSAGWTPLFAAVSGGQKDVVELLVSNGADVNAKINHCSPLWFAIIDEDKEIAELLISKGADINAKDKYGDSLLAVAVAMKNKELVELLIVKGADINIKNNNKETALDIGNESENREIIDILVKSGAKTGK